MRLRAIPRFSVFHFGQRYLGAVLICCMGSSSAQAAEFVRQPLVVASAETAITQLLSRTHAEARFQQDSTVRTLQPLEWYRWGHPTAPAPRPRVVASDGSCYVARQDWSTRVPVALFEAELEFDHATFGKIRFPRDEIELILLQAASEPAMARNIKEEIRTQPPEQDRVWLTGGDAFTGEALSFDGTLHFRLGQQDLSLAAADIAAIYLRGTQERAQFGNPDSWLGLDDGTLVAANGLAIGKESIVATTGFGTPLKGKRKDQIVFLQSAGTDRYLSDQSPLDFLHSPYYDIGSPLALNQNLHNQTAIAAGNRYLKCLAMQTAARAAYQVPERATHMHAYAAIDDSSGESGSAIFRVYRVVDGKPELAHETDIIRGGEAPRLINVDLEQAQAIILVVDFADYGDELDHCLWLDPCWISTSAPPP